MADGYMWLITLLVLKLQIEVEIYLKKTMLQYINIKITK